MEIYLSRFVQVLVVYAIAYILFCKYANEEYKALFKKHRLAIVILLSVVAGVIANPLKNRSEKFSDIQEPKTFEVRPKVDVEQKKSFKQRQQEELKNLKQESENEKP